MRRAFFVICGVFLFCLLFAGKSYAAVSYTVQPGDTLYLIARSYGLTPQDLIEANGLTSTTIVPGQVLIIPVADNSTSSYVVKPGDTLFLIAKAYGITVDSLIKANNLKTTTIYPGQVLQLPACSSAGSSSIQNSSCIRYTVQPGDTLYLIAKAYGTTVDRIMADNNLTTTWIYPGQVLYINAGNSEASRGEVSSSDAYLLAQLIYAEARGEIFEGQVAVGAVVLNRVKDPRFPKTIRDVIYEPWQFESVLNGQINLTPDAVAIRAANAALSGADPTGGALYFYNPSKADGSFFKTLTYLCTIGNHAFYK
ncbi:MAG: LysM peptidoglycan-binding domain-containing protein [Thermacetogeniaceae bacterium]